VGAQGNASRLQIILCRMLQVAQEFEPLSAEAPLVLRKFMRGEEAPKRRLPASPARQHRAHHPQRHRKPQQAHHKPGHSTLAPLRSNPGRRDVRAQLDGAQRAVAGRV